MKNCKGEQCSGWGDVNHSPECIAAHDKIYTDMEAAPTCFDRAESSGRVFDNCRFMHTCKSVKPICVNNPK